MLADNHVVESQMFGMPCVKIGGKMFAGLWKNQLVVKIGVPRVTELLKAKAGAQFLAGKSKTDAGRGKLLKLPKNKTQVNQQAAKAGVPVVAVQAKDAAGNTVAESTAPGAGPGLAQVKQAIAKKVAGKSTIVVKPVEQAITERITKVAGEKGAALKGKKAAPASAPPEAADIKVKD